MVQAQRFSPRDFLKHRLQEGAGGLEQVRPHLFEQVTPLFAGERLDQVPLRGRKHPLQADDQSVTEQIRADILGSPAQLFLFEASDPLANGRLDLGLGSHCRLDALHRIVQDRKLALRG